MTKFDEVIPSGSEGKVYASVDVSHAVGPIEKSIDVETNDAAQPHAKLSIKATIKTYFDIKPMEQIRFTVSKGKADSKELTITPTYEKPLKLLAPKTTNPEAFDLKLTPPAGGSKDYKLLVSLKSTIKVGNQSATVTIPVEGGTVPAPEIQVFAVVRGPIEANPALVSFQVKTFPDEISATSSATVYQQPDESTPVVTKSDAGQPMRVIAQKSGWYQVITGGTPNPAPTNPGQPAMTRVGWVKKSDVKTTREAAPPPEQNITLVKATGNFKVLEMISTLEEVKLELQPKEGEAKTFTIKARLADPGEIKKNEAPGSIIVKTDDPEQPEVRVPLYVIVS